ncbi:hypothetical protein EI427_05595 [Flammeovirga pectinis]|uniref:Uncharacterized protein n=1 Tax=Flammeovirga pectinis TaxID=2494373 RepID=A0A3Q9FM09_9BACT|nr:hypothetical protein [Flammeovirga pectinis]AZQ61725.1 hypothetical protein EI427_05595 [Flammeovirga pectinis]
MKRPCGTEIFQRISEIIHWNKGDKLIKTEETLVKEGLDLLSLGKTKKIEHWRPFIIRKEGVSVSSSKVFDLFRLYFDDSLKIFAIEGSTLSYSVKILEESGEHIKFWFVADLLFYPYGDPNIEIKNYIKIFHENDFETIMEVNQFISDHEMWDEFKGIRANLTFSNEKKYKGIEPCFYNIISKLLDNEILTEEHVVSWEKF